MTDPALPPGIHPMMFAFFGPDGTLDRAAMRRQVRAARACGVQGLAVLGLGSEIAKLSAAERRTLRDWAAEDLEGSLPLTVTVAEPDTATALAAVREAASAGAACAILQPPTGGPGTEAALAAFFAAVAEAAPIPVGIQNAPDYLGTGLGLDALVRLVEDAPNIRLLKAEGSALYAAEVVAATAGRVQVFGGRGGLELIDGLRAGCTGMIPALDSADLQAGAFAAFQAGDEAGSEALYARFLPGVVFMMQSLDSFLTYGKRIAAARLGLGPVHDRAPFLAPTPTGLAWTARYAAALPPLPTD
jgi:4-hydroxy-tetrahydrodipicolinate synthase